MKGRTHLAAGLAVGLLAIHPRDWASLAAGVAAAAAGAAVPDIDAPASRPRARATLVIAVILLAAAALIALDGRFGLNLSRELFRDERIAGPAGGAAGFALICALGMNTPHRAFMHSFFAMGALGFCVFLMYPPAVPYFVAAFLSHIFLDYLNSRDICFFYPLPFCRHSLGIAAEDGFADRVVFALGTALTVWLLILIPLDILGVFDRLAAAAGG